MAKAHWSDRPRWRSLRSVAEIFGIAVGVFGVALLLLELEQMETASQREGALNFIERFNSEEIADARFLLEDVILAINDRSRGGSDADRPTDAQVELLVEGELLAPDPASREKLRALLQTVRFLDEAALCVAAELCVKHVICQYLTAFAAGVMNDFGSVINEYSRRNDLRNLGRGAAALGRYECSDAFPPS